MVSNLFMFHFRYGMSSFPLTFIFFKMVVAPPTTSDLAFRATRPGREKKTTLQAVLHDQSVHGVV